eukprot:992948-Rhodomonas_salina.4
MGPVGTEKAAPCEEIVGCEERESVGESAERGGSRWKGCGEGRKRREAAGKRGEVMGEVRRPRAIGWAGAEMGIVES